MGIQDGVPHLEISRPTSYNSHFSLHFYQLSAQCTVLSPLLDTVGVLLILSCWSYQVCRNNYFCFLAEIIAINNIIVLLRQFYASIALMCTILPKVSALMPH